MDLNIHHLKKINRKVIAICTARITTFVESISSTMFILECIVTIAIIDLNGKADIEISFEKYFLALKKAFVC